MTNAVAITNLTAAYNSASFKLKQKITGKTAAWGTTNVEIMVPLKYLSNFWRTLEMPLISYEINLILIWSEKCLLSNDTKATTFAITDEKFYVPVVTVSTQDNSKLLQKLKSDFKRIINSNKYQWKVTIQSPNPDLDYLIDPSFQGIKRAFVLSFENTTERTVPIKCYLPTVEIKDYNVMIDRQHFFDQPVKSNLRTYDNIRKIAFGQGDVNTTGCLDYNYFNNYCKMISIDLSKQQALKAIQKQYNKLILHEI